MTNHPILISVLLFINLFLLLSFLSYPRFPTFNFDRLIFILIYLIGQLKNNFKKLPISNQEIERGKNLLIMVQSLLQKNNLTYAAIDKFNLIPDYKYFSGLLSTILDHQKKYGISILNSLLSLRTSLAKDLQFQESFEQSLKMFLLQMLAGHFAIQFLYYFSKKIFNFSSSFVDFALILWQVLGLFSCYYLAKKYSKKYLAPLAISFEFLSLIDSFSGVSISATYLSQKLPLDNLKKLEGVKDFSFFVTGLKKILETWLHHGASPQNSLPLYFAEWEFQQGQILMRIKRVLSILNFAGLIIFNLIPYFFLVLYFLFSKY